MEAQCYNYQKKYVMRLETWKHRDKKIFLCQDLNWGKKCLSCFPK